MSSAAALNSHPPTWKIWANPIVRRYARSRLRPRTLGIWLLVVVLVSVWMATVWRDGYYLGEFDEAWRTRRAIRPLLIFQGILLFMLGTGQMAAAMTAEADEGVIDYQRLAPMTPLAKVLGFLFGLPIREYVLFLATMPVMIWVLWKSQTPLEIALQLYGIFLLAALLYHLTGLVAGTVVKNRRWAFLISMGLVFVLYTVMPFVAQFGLVYFKYLTIYPCWEEWSPYLVASRHQPEPIDLSAKFFGINLPQVVFTALTQVVFGLTFVVMLWRRWHRYESHLLGKVGAVGAFGWIQLMILGIGLPLIETGEVFPSSNTRGYFMARGEYWIPHPSEVLPMIGVYGVISLLFLLMTIMLITPNRDRQIRGWRRTRKLGRSSLPFASDPTSATPWVGLMVLMGAGGWYWFAKSVVGSHWFGATPLPLTSLLAFALSLATAGFGFQAILEGKGGRPLTLSIIILGVVPLLVGTVIANSNENLVPVATWITGISPAAGTVYAVGSTIPIVDMTRDLVRAMPRAFWFWQALSAMVVINLLWQLRASRETIAQESAPEDSDGDKAEA